MDDKMDKTVPYVKGTGWGSKDGVATIIQGEPCAYALGVIKSRGPKKRINLYEMASLQRINCAELGVLYFVYDHVDNAIGIAYSKRLNPHGHDGIADAMGVPGASGSDDRYQRIVGGKIAFINEKFISVEWSGHYGHLWTDKIRKQFQKTFYNATKNTVKHLDYNEKTKELRILDYINEMDAHIPIKPAEKPLKSGPAESPMKSGSGKRPMKPRPADRSAKFSAEDTFWELYTRDMPSFFQYARVGTIPLGSCNNNTESKTASPELSKY